MLTDAEREGRRPHARLITCARCGAKPGKPCRTRTGARATAAHAVRTEPDPGKQARRIEQAAMLEAAQVPDDLVPVMCKIAARGKILTDDLVAIERAGVMLGIEVAYTRRRP